MRIDIKYGDQVISTIEEEEAQILATQNTYATNNIIVDVVEEGGVDTSDATATTSQIAAGKIAYIATGRTVGTAAVNNETSVSPLGTALQVPSGIYRADTLATFPVPVVTTTKETTTVDNIMTVNSHLALAQSAYLDTNGISGETFQVSINDLASGEQTVIDNGTYNIAARKTLNVAVPYYNNEFIDCLDLTKFTISPAEDFYIITSSEIEIYPTATDCTYTGVPQVVYINSFIPELMVLSGDTTATERGTYNCLITLVEGYKFKDSQLNTRILEWKIQ